MKRIFTISVAAVMALLMVLSLTACGNSTLGYYKLTSAEASGMSFAAVLTAATAWLEYHALPHLSTPFFLFFRVFLLFSSALHFSLSICYDKGDF